MLPRAIPSVDNGDPGRHCSSSGGSTLEVPHDDYIRITFDRPYGICPSNHVTYQRGGGHLKKRNVGGGDGRTFQGLPFRRRRELPGVLRRQDLTTEALHGGLEGEPRPRGGLVEQSGHQMAPQDLALRSALLDPLHPASNLEDGGQDFPVELLGLDHVLELEPLPGRRRRRALEAQRALEPLRAATLLAVPRGELRADGGRRTR